MPGFPSYLPANFTACGSMRRIGAAWIVFAVIAMAAHPRTRKKHIASSFVNGWYAMTHRTRNRQPHWITPVATLTPLLEQEYRFDIQRQSSPLLTAWQWGGGKGLELIPTRSTEVIITQPNFFCPGHGFNCSWQSYGGLLKYRLAAAPESAGNYVVTAFLGASHALTGGIGQVAPGAGWGKGWGRFDIQQAFSFGFITGLHSFTLSSPAGNSLLQPPDHQLSLNTALQYHYAARKLWPELELNAAWLRGGNQPGMTAYWLTPGIVLGPYRLHKSWGFTFGVGEQFPLSAFPGNVHNLIFTFRLPF